MSKETYIYKRQEIAAARELCYPETIILRLHSATTDSEIARIMRTAREMSMKQEEINMSDKKIVATYDYYTLDQAREIIYEEIRHNKAMQTFRENQKRQKIRNFFCMN